MITFSVMEQTQILKTSLKVCYFYIAYTWIIVIWILKLEAS